MENKINKSKSGVTRFFHPLSAALMLFIDLSFFGVDAITIGFSLFFTIFLAFLITFTGVFLIQKKMEHNSFLQSFLKASLLGIAAGLPTPIAGTAFGVIILALAGIKSFRIKK
jgi:hypothetical protein